MIEKTRYGLTCAVGGFTIDPNRAVETAVITHAHSDHARRGSAVYHAHPITASLMRARLGSKISVIEHEYGETFELGEVRVSLHPAGHVAGSSQVRCEHLNDVWVATGDYKRETDPVSAPFEVVPCDTFITESTFALPIYQWPNPASVQASINHWWTTNRDEGSISVIRAYSLGKAQRIFSTIDTSIGPIYVSDPINKMNAVLRSHDIHLPSTQDGPPVPGALVLTSASFDNPNNIPVHYAEASGWNAVRRNARSGAMPFVVSDHVDWPALMKTIEETGCKQVLCIHGFTNPLSRYLTERGYSARSLEGGEGRTKSFNATMTTQRAMKLREDVCSEHDLPHWMFDECFGHTKNLAETASLIRTGAYRTETRLQRPKPTPEEAAPELALESVKIKVVLYHLHRSPGGRGIGKLTMGVWKDEELVPLAHVANTLSTDQIAEIESFAEHNTTIAVGPVRTISPRFVFTIAVEGLSFAPRRKIGIRVHGATIVDAHPDALPTDAATLDTIARHAEGLNQ